MKNSDFEPFGEPVARVDALDSPRRGSAGLMRLGTGVFWLLVIAIVFARAVYFEPGIFDFDRVVAVARSLFVTL